MAQQLTIADMGALGEGIAHSDEGTIFVPFALPGEHITASIEGNRAASVTIEKASPERVEPICPHFGICGGCQTQHWAEAPYVVWKRQLVATALKQVGLMPQIDDLISAHGEGRRRATLHARRDGAGFLKAKSHDLHQIEHCPILAAPLANAPQIATSIAAIIGDCNVAFTATETGLDLNITRPARGKKRFALTDAHRQALTNIARTHDLARLSFASDIVAQRRVPQISFDDIRVDLPPGSFLQPTAKGEEVLAALVADGIGKAKGNKVKKVADLFCGLGPFALRLAGTHKIFAADLDAPAIAALDKAMQFAPGLKRLGVERHDLFRLPLLARDLNEFDAIVLDPPRAGAEAQVREIARSKVKRVVYVSCDPRSFARDARILADARFTLSRVTPVDQFRYTPHVELVAVFTR